MVPLSRSASTCGPRVYLLLCPRSVARKRLLPVAVLALTAVDPVMVGSLGVVTSGPDLGGGGGSHSGGSNRPSGRSFSCPGYEISGRSTSGSLEADLAAGECRVPESTWQSENLVPLKMSWPLEMFGSQVDLATGEYGVSESTRPPEERRVAEGDPAAGEY